MDIVGGTWDKMVNKVDIVSNLKDSFGNKFQSPNGILPYKHAFIVDVIMYGYVLGAGVEMEVSELGNPIPQSIHCSLLTSMSRELL